MSQLKNNLLRYIVFLITAVALFLGLLVSASAQEPLSSSARELFSSLDAETRELLSGLGLESFEIEALFSLSPSLVLSQLARLVRDGIKKPLAAVGIIMGTAVLISFSNSLLHRRGTAQSMNIVLLLVICLEAAAPLLLCVRSAINAIKLLCDFTLCLVPVLAVALTGAGKAGSALCWSTAVLTLCQFISRISFRFLPPLIGSYAALGLVSALTPVFNFQNISQFIKKLFSVFLGLGGSIFSGLLSIKTGLASTADNIAARGVRFLIGGLVPVVGSSVSEALGSVIGSVRLAGGSLGSFGIIALAAIALPCLVEILLWWTALVISSFVAGLLGESSVGLCLQSLANVLVMLNILLIFVAVIFIVSTGLVLNILKN